MRGAESVVSGGGHVRAIVRWRLLLGLASLLVLGSCSRGYNYVFRHRQLTGTCAGACKYYLSCKTERGYRVLAQDPRRCQLECQEVFSTADSLRAFESLRCPDAIAFVEGPSGRMPGQPLPPEAPSSPRP